MSLKSEREREAYENSSKGKQMDPSDASEYLSNVIGATDNGS